MFMQSVVIKVSKYGYFIKQRAASSLGFFSDLCNLNRTEYLYVFSCISLFLCTIIHLAGHQSLIHTEFCMTKIIYVNFYDSHTLSLHIVATSLTKTLKKIVSSTGIWAPDTSHTKRARYPCTAAKFYEEILNKIKLF
jgi:hypothetical protein